MSGLEKHIRAQESCEIWERKIKAWKHIGKHTGS